MKNALKETVDALPKLLEQNAPSMMRRMLAAALEEIAADGSFVNPTFSALLLKVSEPDLLREFKAAIRESTTSIEHLVGDNNPGNFVSDLSLSMELVDGSAEYSGADFHASTVQFDSLCAHAKKLEVSGVDFYRNELFLASLKVAFSKSRIEAAEVAKIMPYLRRALNTELLNLYRKLGSL